MILWLTPIIIDMKKGYSKRITFLFFSVGNYSAGLIAPTGHASTHVPQSAHTSGSIVYTSPEWIAPTGHSSMHEPQATHTFGSILCAILFSFLIN